MKPVRGRRPEPQPVVPLLIAGAWALLLLVAPAAHNAFWAVNGLRSVPLPVALALLVAAALAAIAAAKPPRAAWTASLAALALALLLGFPLRERLHLLGDTAGRRGSVAVFANREAQHSLGEWSRALHAQPLDLLTGLLAPGWITRATGHLNLGVSGVLAVLALVFFAGAWRLARRLSPAGESAWPLWIALFAWGGLEAYAGYTESAGVLLAAGVWWWCAMLEPVARRRDAFVLALAWLGVWLSHRIAFALLVPQLVRLLARPHAGDATAARREAVIWTLVVAAMALAAQWAGGGQLGRDVADVLQPPAADALASVPTDLLNLALFSAPLALLALLLDGIDGWRKLAASEAAPALLAGTLVLLPTAFPLPVSGNGLGVQRDWDLSILLGLTLTLAGAIAIAKLPAARRRTALLLAAPLLVLQTGAFVAVNADLPAASDRARALVQRPPTLGRQQASGVLMVLGDRALGQGHAVEAAQMLIASWQMVPSPARGLHAVRACYLAGDLTSARKLLADVRGRAALPPSEAADARSLEQLIEAGARDSAAAGR